MKHAGLHRAIKRCQSAIRQYDTHAIVYAECFYHHAPDEIGVSITTESTALAKGGRRKTATIAGFAGTPSVAAALFIEGLRRVVEDKGLSWLGER